MAYRVELKPSAARALKRVPRRDRRRIARRIDALAQNPRPKAARKLSGAEAIYRVRAGDYRILYQIQDDVLLVLVVRIGHRREVYRGLS
ncbi:MAG: type II toxin-antitoxin system RelE/ParE family toxin [Phycisphaerae bacterium]